MDTSGIMDVDYAATGDDDSKCRPRVNGRLLAKHKGRGVCLLGRVVACPTPTSMILTTSDSVQVKVTLSNSISEELSGSIVELCGVATSETEMAASVGMLAFSDELTASFDMEVYNKAVEICDKFSQAYYQKH